MIILSKIFIGNTLTYSRYFTRNILNYKAGMRPYAKTHSRCSIFDEEKLF